MRTFRTKATLLAAIAVAALTPSSTFADAVSFDGQSLEFEYMYPNTGSPLTTQHFTVGSGVESPNGYASQFGLDVSASTVDVDFRTSSTWASAAFNGFRLTDYTGSIAAITGVSLVSTNMTGLTQSRVTFDANNVFVNWNGLSFNADTFVSLSVAFQTPAGESSATPLPAAATAGLALMGGLGLKRGRRKVTA
jgi:hypothetical protein